MVGSISTATAYTVQFRRAWNRPTILLAYLTGQGINQVYTAETEDHAYNLVVDSRHYVYVIDSNQQFYRHIRTIRDFIAAAHNESVDIRFEDDYANPPGAARLISTPGENLASTGARS